MKKKPIPIKLKKLVKDAIKRHAWNIGVSHFTGDILYMEEDKKDEEQDANVAADITVDRRYLLFTLRIYPHAIRLWKERGEVFMEEVIAHEISHLVTEHLHWLAVCPFKDEGELKDAWETLTTIVGKLSVTIDEFERKRKK